jgi:hypothetical protein
MSFSGNDDKLRIPIEIKTEDSKEIRELIQDISEAEQDLREIRPRKGKGDPSVFRGAFQQSGAEEGFGIFGQRRGEEALPQQLRDKQSKQAFERSNAFKDLQSQVQQVEKQQQDLISTTTAVAQNLGLTGLLTSGAGIGNKVKGAAQDVTGLTSIAKNPTGKLGGAMMGMGTKAFLPLFIATAAIESAQMVLDLLQQPGGLLDRRFKRIVSDEIAGATERQEKAEIRQGIRLIRISPYAGFRGEATAVAGAAVQRGQPQSLIDNDAEYRSKGG